MSGLKYFYFPLIRQSSDLYSYVNVAYFYTMENWYILSLKEPGQLLKWHKNLVYELVLWELTHQVLSPHSASSAGLHKISKTESIWTSTELLQVVSGCWQILFIECSSHSGQDGLTAWDWVWFAQVYRHVLAPLRLAIKQADGFISS